MRNNEQLANTQDFDTSAPLRAMESVISRPFRKLWRTRQTHQPSARQTNNQPTEQTNECSQGSYISKDIFTDADAKFYIRFSDYLIN